MAGPSAAAESIAPIDPIDVLRLYRRHNYTISDALKSRAAADPARLFMRFGENAYDWANVISLSKQLACGLAAHGVGVGDRVLISAPNCPAHVLLLLAAARLGAIMVPVNSEFGVTELAYIVGNGAPKLVLMDGRQGEEIARAACAQAGLAPEIISFDAGEGGAGLAVLYATGEPPHTAISADTPCLLIYTSGTSGFPKGVLHTQRSYLLSGEAFVQRLRVQPDDRLMIVLPLFHINALFYSVGGAIAAGCAIVIAGRFSASNFWTVAAETGATAVNVIEAIGAILCLRDRSEYRPDHKIRKAYGVRASSAGTFRSEFSVPYLISGYALTEAPGVLSPPFFGPEKLGSMGVLGRHPDPTMPWSECRVVDEEGRDIPDGETGELVLQSPVIMQGYFRDPEATAAAFRDGWFLTGDLVRRDEDGYYFFVSRKKDIIRRRGENISGAELDRVVGEHPAVREAAAIAVPAELGEDEIMVVVVPQPGQHVTAEQIADWCAARLSAIKIPRYIVFENDLPRTPTHKVAKQAMKADKALRARAIDLGARKAGGGNG